MRDYDDCKAFLDLMESEHRQLTRVLQRIDGCFRGEWSRDAVSVKRELVDLRRQVEQHFTEEECGEGSLEEACCRCPNLSSQVAELRHEHSVLLATVDELVRSVDRVGMVAGVTPGPAEDIPMKFARFAESLHAHEAAENRVLQQAFGTGEGLQDE